MSKNLRNHIDSILQSIEHTEKPRLPGSFPPGNSPAIGSDEVLAMLAMAAPDTAPPADMFEKIIARTEPPALPGIETVLADTGKWIDRGNGVWRKTMATSPDGKNVYLLRCSPGSTIPAHRHAGWEYALVLEGQFQIAGRTVRAGDAQVSAVNTDHPEINSTTGCLLLVVA